LSAVTDRVAEESPPQAGAFNDALAAYVHQLPQLREIVVLDAEGHWQFSSTGVLQPYSNADRDYFRYHQAHADNAVRVNTPVLSRGTNRWTLLLTRRVGHPDGSFAGVVVGAIDLGYFQSLYETFAIGDKARSACSAQMARCSSAGRSLRKMSAAMSRE
jgi:hypothetical protein